MGARESEQPQGAMQLPPTAFPESCDAMQAMKSAVQVLLDERGARRGAGLL